MESLSKILKLLLLCSIILGTAGCASTEDTTDGLTQSDATTKSQEDQSHGWGTSIQNSGGH